MENTDITLSSGRVVRRVLMGGWFTVPTSGNPEITIREYDEIWFATPTSGSPEMTDSEYEEYLSLTTPKQPNEE